MGLDVASLNTVQFSNHSGYRRLKGFRTTAGQISDLYDGLKDCGLDDFDMLLTGYIPSEECVEAVGRIAKDMKEREGGCFWRKWLPLCIGDMEEEELMGWNST